jgi:hypothetical protein
MSIITDVKDYEKWLAGHCTIVPDGLKKKHARMADDAFDFFRATCFRFAKQLDSWLPAFRRQSFAESLHVPSTGDSHIENWGTWRDGEGRLVWGVNDFDESAILPYAYDLLRLATSAELAPNLPGDGQERAKAILDGYRQGLAMPRPFLIDDTVSWFQELLNDHLRKPDAFRKDLAKATQAVPPTEVMDILNAALPTGTTEIEYRAWQRGGGSLGRPRYLAIGCWQGGQVIREAKALVPSAWDWAVDDDGSTNLFELLAKGRFRSPDPFLNVSSSYIVRRLAPDSHKINLADKDAEDYNSELLTAMGADLAAIHLSGRADPATILADISGRMNPKSFAMAAATIAKAVRHEFEEWETYYEALGKDNR